MSVGSRGRKGSTGTGMNIERRQYQSGPRLKLPPMPIKSAYFSRKQIVAAAAEARAKGNLVMESEFLSMHSWGEALEIWKRDCDEARTAHAAKVRECQARVKAGKARKEAAFKATVDYCEANGLPSPRRNF